VTPDLVERATELRIDGYSVGAIAERLGLSTRSTFRALALARDGLPQLPAVADPGLDETRLVASVGRAAVAPSRTPTSSLSRARARTRGSHRLDSSARIRANQGAGREI
jgi:hypothetical protein